MLDARVRRAVGKLNGAIANGSSSWEFSWLSIWRGSCGGASHGGGGPLVNETEEADDNDVCDTGDIGDETTPAGIDEFDALRIGELISFPLGAAIGCKGFY